MIEDRRLSYSDAIDVLAQNIEFSFSELDLSASTTINLRLLSGLLQKKSEPLVAIESLVNQKIVDLANAEKDPLAIKTYLGILISREDKRGPELVMDRFQKGLLLGEEVIELLGRNAKFSMQVLSNASQTHDHSVQLSELARKYPIETGHISIGMFVRTPCGWGRIESIEDSGGLNLQFISQNEKQVKFHLVLYSGTSHALKAILDIENEKMNLLGSEKFYQCGICGFAATTQNFILREHTREVHNGVGSSFAPISSRLSVRGELQFSQTYPA